MSPVQTTQVHIFNIYIYIYIGERMDLNIYLDDVSVNFDRKKKSILY